MRNGSGDMPRKFRDHMMQDATYLNVVLPVIRQEYGPLKHAAEYLARDAGSTPRAAENWLAGLCAPTGEKLLNLMAACERLRVAVNDAAMERRTNLRQRAAEAEKYVRQRRLTPGISNAAKNRGLASVEGL